MLKRHAGLVATVLAAPARPAHAVSGPAARRGAAP